MGRTLEEVKQGYIQEMTDVNFILDKLNSTLAQQLERRQQLKGAIHGLETLLKEQSLPNPPQAPVAPPAPTAALTSSSSTPPPAPTGNQDQSGASAGQGDAVTSSNSAAATSSNSAPLKSAKSRK